MIHEIENVMTLLRSQEHPISFLKGHDGDRVLGVKNVIPIFFNKKCDSNIAFVHKNTYPF